MAEIELCSKKQQKVQNDRQNHTFYSLLRGTWVKFTRQNINIDRINNIWRGLQKVEENSKRSTKSHFLVNFNTDVQYTRKVINIDKINNFLKFSENLAQVFHNFRNYSKSFFPKSLPSRSTNFVCLSFIFYVFPQNLVSNKVFII